MSKDRPAGMDNTKYSHTPANKGTNLNLKNEMGTVAKVAGGKLELASGGKVNRSVGGTSNKAFKR